MRNFIIIVCFYFLSKGLIFGQSNPSIKEHFYLEPSVDVYAITYTEEFYKGTSNQYTLLNTQLRFDLSLDLVYRDERWLGAIGASLLTVGRQVLESNMKNQFVFYDVYGKVGYNLAYHFKRDSNYFGPFVSYAAILDQGVHDAIADYKFGLDIFSKKNVHFAPYFGFFLFSKNTIKRYEATGVKVNNNFLAGISIGYSLPLRKPSSTK